LERTGVFERLYFKLAAETSVHLRACWSLLPSGTKDEKVEREYKATFTIERPRVACEYNTQ